MKKMLLLLSVILIAAVSCSPKSESSSEISLTEPKFSENGKPVVVVGTFGYHDPLFSDQNNKPTDIEIEIVNYSKGIEADYSTKEKENAYYDAIMHELDMALISGNAPDLLFMSPEDVERLNGLGALTDLYGLMDEQDELKRDDFLPCVLDGMTIDGKLPALMDGYDIYTAVAKTKFVPKEYENWTAAEAMEFYNKFHDEMDFCDRNEESSLADYMLMVEGMNCIDRNNSKCDFSGTFTELLEFCRENPVQVVPTLDFSKATQEQQREYFVDLESKGINDVQLVFPIRITGFTSGLGQDTYGYFNKEDITFVGYPSENGNGTYIYPSSSLFGICSQSGNKENAWKLLCLMLRHQPILEKSTHDGTRGIPVLKVQLQRDYDRPADYHQSINNDDILYNAVEQEGGYITQEYKDMLYEYILSVPANPYRAHMLQYIIDEEIDPVILDDRTAEQAAEILKSRIEIYLSERS